MVCTLLSHKILLTVLDVDSAVLGLKNPAALTNSLKAMLFVRSLTAYRDNISFGLPAFRTEFSGAGKPAITMPYNPH